MKAKVAQVDTISSVMNAAGDKMVTNDKGIQNSPSRKGGNAGPAATVKFGSASVPIYLSESKGRKRYFIAHYRDGKRIRKAFPDFAAAKKEALFVAQRIQSGMQHVTDLKPHERDSYAKAVELLGELKLPLVAAVEDYIQARKLAETESLTSMATDYRKFFKPLTRRMSVPELVALEAGNSPSVIFKNYRELATEEQADEWFGILPKEGQRENTYQWDHRARIVTLPAQLES